jgi:flagellar assembly factor FliW
MKMPILGFENILEVEFTEIDDILAKVTDVDNEAISFTLINPYSLREYSFDLPQVAQVMLDIKDDSELFVYNIIAVQKPTDASVVNFLAPIVFNKSNGHAAQVVLESEKYVNYGLAQPVKDFLAA